METGPNGKARATEPRVTLRAAPERQLIRPAGSRRHLLYTISVEKTEPVARPDRTPLRLVLVLDRSGSMQGDKLTTAKRAALAVIDQLDERDRLAVVSFDNRIDVIQPLEFVTSETKRHLRLALDQLSARANTALHEGWLAGCQAIASDTQVSTGDDAARCFLLTDGLANVGLTDPEQIAAQAAGVRERAGVSTSTFGIGDDYNESLLGPMAIAGGGQFHHLRTAADIADTFTGEVSDLLAVAVRQVRLELEGANDTTAEVISAYWAESTTGDGRVSVAVGDLLAGDERQVVVRFGFPEGREGSRSIRARVVWRSSDGDHATDWQSITLRYAADLACDGDRHDPAVMHWVGLHHAERSKLAAMKLNRSGDVQTARAFLADAIRHIGAYAKGDAELLAAVRDLRDLEREIAERRISSMVSKETIYQSQRLSRMQKDYRRPQ